MDLVEYQVSIIGARKLIGKDGLLTKTSDPYCVATVGSCRYQTKVLYRDLEPCWDEKCVLVDLRTNVIYPVRFEVFDLNLGSVDCSLGHCYVTPGSMGWVLLEGAEHGEIQVQVTALPVETLKRIASLEAKIEQLSLENNKSTAQSNATSLCVVDGLQAFYYNIFIQSATGINSADRNGLSDPYCVIELGSHSQKTSIRDATLNPVYEETFEFICCKPEIIKVCGMLLFCFSLSLC